MATKTESLTIKVTPEQKEMIRQKANEADMTISKFLYRWLFPKDAEQEEIKIPREK